MCNLLSSLLKKYPQHIFPHCSGALLAYHSLLITKGETCIERHINRKNKEACKRFKRRFHNPYDFGARQNWRNFLLGNKARDSNCSYGPLISLIVPLDNPPIGDGFTWQKVEQGFIWVHCVLVHRFTTENNWSHVKSVYSICSSHKYFYWILIRYKYNKCVRSVCVVG